jgi:hypothetical protein
MKGTKKSTISHFLFHQGIFDQQHHDCHPLPSRHFDTTEGIKAESLAVLNTLTGQNFQDAFKKW